MRESRELNIRQSSVDKLEIDENVADFLLLWATDGENDRVTGARRDNLSIGFNQSISIFIVPYFRMITFRSAVEIRQLLVMVARSSFSKSEYHNKSSEALLGKGLQNKQKRHEAFDSPTPHFLREGAHPGGYDPQIRTWPRFLYSAPTPKFHHPMFTRSEVIVLTNKQTNKQTPLKTSNALGYATTLGKQLFPRHRYKPKAAVGWYVNCPVWGQPRWRQTVISSFIITLACLVLSPRLLFSFPSRFPSVPFGLCVYLDVITTFSWTTTLEIQTAYTWSTVYTVAGLARSSTQRAGVWLTDNAGWCGRRGWLLLLHSALQWRWQVGHLIHRLSLHISVPVLHTCIARAAGTGCYNSPRHSHKSSILWITVARV